MLFPAVKACNGDRRSTAYRTLEDLNVIILRRQEHASESADACRTYFI